MTYLGSVFDYKFFFNDRNGNYTVTKDSTTVANPSTEEEMLAYMSRVGKTKGIKDVIRV